MTIENIRAIIRPLLMLSGWGVALILAFSDMDTRKLVIGAVILASGEWLGERASRRKENEVINGRGKNNAQ